MALTSTSIAWRGLTLATGAATYRLVSLDGWEELPAEKFTKAQRVNAHGSHPSRVWADERIVTAMGFCWTATDRDQLLAAMQSQLVFGSGDDGEPLAITLGGRTLTASAQLIGARQAVIRGEWGVGRFGWAVRWRCTDPLRYGATDSATTPLPMDGGGLTYPLTYPLDYGAAGISGRITVRNPGTAPAPLLLGVRGGLPQGWQVSASGQRIASPTALPAGQTWDIDTGAGTVLVEGTASRRGQLTVADWFTVPPQGSVELQFTSFGGDRDPAALLTASCTAAYW